MRYTQGTVATLACGILLLLVLWFQPETPVVSDAVAESKREDSTTEAAPSQTGASIPRPVAGTQTVAKPDVPWSSAGANQSPVEAKLAELIPAVKFDGLPLHEVLVELTKLTGITMYFDQEEIGDVIDPDVPIYVEAAAGDMSFETLLSDFILAPNDLVFVIRDNFLVIMSYDKSLVTPEATKVVVYDCRDLVPSFGSSGASRARLSERLRELADNRIGAGAMNLTVPPPSDAELRFMWVIVNTVHPGSWVMAGRYVPNPELDYYDIYGSINCFDGLVVVRHSRDVHREIEELLQKLRAAKR